MNQNDGQPGDWVIQSDEANTEEPGLADEGTTDEPSAGEATETPDGAEVEEGNLDEAGLA